jgi:hypothetical protein
MPRKNPISAAELIAKCEADPKWVAQRDAREAGRQPAAAEVRRAEAPLIRDLRRVGVNVSSAWDLVNTSVPYPSALPVLVAHLARPYPDPIREGIARALAVRDAEFAWARLVDAYVHEPAGQTKEGLACALSVLTDDARLDQLLGLVADQRNGVSRALLLRALEKSRSPKAQAALDALQIDPDLQGEIAEIRKRADRRERRRLARVARPKRPPGGSVMRG